MIWLAKPNTLKKIELGHRSQCHQDFSVSSSLQTKKSNAVSIPKFQLLPQSLRQGWLLHWTLYHPLSVLLATCPPAACHAQIYLTQYLPIPIMKEHCLINKQRISRLKTFFVQAQRLILSSVGFTPLILLVTENNLKTFFGSQWESSEYVNFLAICIAPTLPQLHCNFHFQNQFKMEFWKQKWAVRKCF